MKTWMKILMWAGLGGGIGFFAGYQVGNKRNENAQMDERPAYEEGYNQALRDSGLIKPEETWEDIKKEMEDYRGGDSDGDAVTVISDDDPPMVEEPPVIGDEEDIEEIPELHPQHLIPEQITEEEYYDNPWGYDQEQLVYYELDEVLFNKDTRKALKKKDDQDQAVGIGMLFNFYLKDGETLDAIFVKNDTMGVVFRIDRMEAAYTDEMDIPEYEEDDTE